jgi:SNF2 family DNA or RNA helicase
MEGVLEVHALWSAAGRLCLWGRRPGARSAVAADELSSLAEGGQPTELTLLLPAGGSLRRRRVPALALSPGTALDLLPELAAEPPAAVAPAGTVHVLARLAELALEVAAAGRVLPTLVCDDGWYLARWTPHLLPDDLRRLRVLTEALPPAARAEVSARDPQGRAGGEVVREFAEAAVDAAARAAAGCLSPPPDGSAAAAWLAALTRTDAVVRASGPQLEKLRVEVEAWRRSAAPPTAPFRTCFRLQPPDGDQEELPWQLDFLFQAADEPTLLVPAEEVWRSRNRLHAVERVQDQPQERLLADLGRASRLWPNLDDALREARPQGTELDVDGAYRFLREAAPLLSQAGFGVLLPSWWRQRQVRVGTKLKAQPRGDTGTGLLGMEGIVEYHWQAAIGDEELSLDELRELASLKVPLVRVRGRWVEVRPDELRRAVAFFERQAAGAPQEATVPELLRSGLGLAPSESGLPVTGVEAGGWLASLLSEAASARPDPKGAPPGFRGSLRPYQERGLGWLWFLDRLGLGACLADDMGLGKTIQLLALLLAERAEAGVSAPPGPTLLICPMSVVGNWQREAERFAPDLAVHVHHGSGRLTGAEFAEAASAADLLLTTYSLVARDRALLQEVPWRRVVLDEAQNVKNSEARQSQAVRSLPTSRRVALTGTPVENRLTELWSIMDFLSPGLLGSASDFRRRFAVPVERYRNEEAAGVLKRLTGPFVLRRLKTDRSVIEDLPEKVEMKIYCNISREQATLYQAILDDMLVRIEGTEGIERRGLVLATMTRLKETLNHPAHLLHDGSRLAGRSGKLSRLEEILEEVVADGDRALCFTQFAEMGGLLRDHLEQRLGREVLFLHGGTPKRTRDAMVDRFQTPSASGPPVLVLSLKAGGTGLNLTAANHVIHFDRWWNPAVEDQATDRAFRIGQRQDVQVRKLVCLGTLEERIDRMLEEKRDLAERIVGAGEGWLTELSTQELRDLVALSAEAVAE